MELGGCKVLIDKMVRYHPNHIHIQLSAIFLTSAHPSASNVSYSIFYQCPPTQPEKCWQPDENPTFVLYPYTCYVRTAIYAVNTWVLLILSFSTGEANKFLTCCLKSLCLGPFVFDCLGPLRVVTVLDSGRFDHNNNRLQWTLGACYGRKSKSSGQNIYLNNSFSGEFRK